MTDFTVNAGGAPYYRYRRGTVKALEARLGEGYEVSGDVSGKLLIVHYWLPGAEEGPDYAIYLDTLTEAVPSDGGGTTLPGGEPLPPVRFVCPAGKLEVIGYDVNDEPVGVFRNTNEFALGDL